MSRIRVVLLALSVSMLGWALPQAAAAADPVPLTEGTVKWA